MNPEEPVTLPPQGAWEGEKKKRCMRKTHTAVTSF